MADAANGSQPQQFTAREAPGSGSGLPASSTGQRTQGEGRKATLCLTLEVKRSYSKSLTAKLIKGPRQVSFGLLP